MQTFNLLVLFAAVNAQYQDVIKTLTKKIREAEGEAHNETLIIKEIAQKLNEKEVIVDENLITELKLITAADETDETATCVDFSNGQVNVAKATLLELISRLSTAAKAKAAKAKAAVFLSSSEAHTIVDHTIGFVVVVEKILKKIFGYDLTELIFKTNDELIAVVGDEVVDKIREVDDAVLKKIFGYDLTELKFNRETNEFIAVVGDEDVVVDKSEVREVDDADAVNAAAKVTVTAALYRALDRAHRALNVNAGEDSSGACESEILDEIISIFLYGIRHLTKCHPPPPH